MKSISYDMDSVEDWFVCYLDIMGYSELINNLYKYPDKVIVLRNGIRDIIKNTIHFFDVYKNVNKNNIQMVNKSIIEKVRFQVLSDSILIMIPYGININTEDKPIDSSQSIVLLVFLHILSMSFFNISSKLGYFLRGSIALGPHYQAPLLEDEPENQFIFSKALVTAVELEKRANYPRILIDNTLLEFIHKQKVNLLDLNIRKDFDNQYMLDVYGILEGAHQNEFKMLENICTVIKKQVALNKNNPQIIQKYYLYSLYHNKCLTKKKYKDVNLFIDIQSVFDK